ncbi:MAG: hypothetical protein BECKG1743D_GA0114223_100673 [Candidatus Kentron sp. G]|nr:MAG: hypothetical protein BECKG1743F_GA0114225_100543 [Candidatus Kentron sp. G]VFM98501.1 MAG: hypothetical protein BECKG1743D_GA0114223_100673 [Candidatus Kentron sp. G]
MRLPRALNPNKMTAQSGIFFSGNHPNRTMDRFIGAYLFVGEEVYRTQTKELAAPRRVE